MTRIGPQELDTLAGLCVGRFVIVGHPRLRRLAEKGLLRAYQDHPTLGPGMYGITSAGLRALADAADAGRLLLEPALRMKEPAP